MKLKYLLITAFIALYMIPGFAQEVSPPEVNEIELEEPEQDPIYEYFEVEKKAMFVGGEQEMMKFIVKNIQYPNIAKEMGISGTVFISFIVEPDSSISHVKIAGNRKLGYGCEKESIRVVKKMSGYWKPAEIQGRAVRMKFMLPIKFVLRN